MKIRKRILLFLLLSVPAFAGARYDNIVLRDSGRPAASAQIRVCTDAATGFPCTPLASIYTDQALTVPIVGSIVTADGLGNFFFYAAPAEYTLEISGPGIATTRIYHDIAIGAVAGGGAVSSVGLSLSNFTCTNSPITSSGTISCSATSPTGTGAFVQKDSPTFTTKIITPNVQGVEAAAGTAPTGTTWDFKPVTAKGWCVIAPTTGTQYCPSQNTSPLTVAGQLFGYNGTIGTAVPAPASDGLVLTSNAAAAGGVKVDWETPTGGGGGTPTAPLPALCYANTTINFSNTATAHTYASCALAGGASNVLDRIIRLKAQGIVSTAGTGPTLTLSVVINGVITLQSTVFTLPASLSNAGWSVDCDLARTVTGVSGATSNYCIFRVDGLTPASPQMDVETTVSGNGTVWDATVAQTIAVQGTFNNASASNSMTGRYSIFEQVNK